MPTLPSGLALAIGFQAIPDDMGIDWFKCPEGHFWYRRPDEAISPPPYDENSSFIEDWVHAPIPINTEEVKKYLYVLYRLDNGRFLWRGEWLNNFPRFVQMDEVDSAAWQEWLNSGENQGFLRQVIDRCKAQAELNKQCTGVAIFTDRPPTPPPAEMSISRENIERLCARARELDRQADIARSNGDKNMAGAIYEELLTKLAPLTEVVANNVVDTDNEAYALYAQGLTLRVLHLFEDAIPVFNKSISLDPNYLDAYLEIAICYKGSDRKSEAINYAKLATKCASDSHIAWSNLAEALMLKGHNEQAYEAINKAIQLAPKDSLSRNDLINFRDTLKSIL